jgi:hypothetical protein
MPSLVQCPFIDDVLDNWPSSRDQLKYQHNDRCHQQQMNEPSKCVCAHQAHEPQNQEDHKDGPEHSIYLLRPMPRLNPDGLDS